MHSCGMQYFQQILALCNHLSVETSQNEKESWRACRTTVTCVLFHPYLHQGVVMPMMSRGAWLPWKVLRDNHYTHTTQRVVLSLKNPHKVDDDAQVEGSQTSRNGNPLNKAHEVEMFLVEWHVTVGVKRPACLCRPRWCPPPSGSASA